MPVYEFQCRACDHQFEDLVSMDAGSAGQACPDCASIDVERLLSSFRSKRSSSGTTISVDGTACLPGPAGSAGRRAGCCGGGCGGCG